MNASLLRDILTGKVDASTLLKKDQPFLRIWSERQPGGFHDSDTREPFDSTVQSRSANVFVLRFWPDGTPVPPLASDESQVVA